MRRTIKACLLLSLSLTGPIIAVPGWSAGEARQAVDIRIEELEGKVDVSTDGNASSVEIGNALELPSRIVTGDDGRILLRQGLTGVDIAPESDVEIPEAAAHGQLIARMIQHRGSAFYDVETRPLEQLKLTVETPYLVAVVKGTQFNVTVVDDSTTISLFEGTLEIRSPDGLQSILLNAGEIAIRSLADDRIRRLPMDADRLDEVARADGRDAVGTAAGSTARTARTATASDSAVVVAGGNASVPTGGTVDGTTVRVATAIEPSGSEVKVSGEVSTGVNPSLGESSIGASAGVSSSVEVASALDVRVATGVDANVDLGGGGVDVALDAGLDTGVDLGGGAVGADVNAGLDTGVSLGDSGVNLGVDVGLDTGVDLGGGSVDLGLDAGLDTGLDLGGTGLDTGLDLGLDTSLSADLGTGGDTGLDLGIDTGLDTGLGLGVDLGVDLGIATDSGLDLGLDTGLGGTDATGGTGGGTSGGSGQSGGGLLGGLLGPLL